MIDKINNLITTEINPALSKHLGSCELVSFKEGIISLKLLGGCVGCPGRKNTLEQGLKPLFQDRLEGIKDIKLVD